MGGGASMLRKSAGKHKNDTPVEELKVSECSLCWHTSHVSGKCNGYDSLTGKCFCGLENGKH
jgi:hypothetical protein